MPWRDPDYRGLAALILAIAIGLTFVIATGSLAWAGKSFSDVGGEALVALGGAVVGALAGYITGRHVDKETPK